MGAAETCSPPSTRDTLLIEMNSYHLELFALHMVRQSTRQTLLVEMDYIFWELLVLAFPLLCVFSTCAPRCVAPIYTPQ